MLRNQRGVGRPVSRRQMLAGMAGFGATAMLTACAPVAQPGAQPAAGEEASEPAAAPPPASNVELSWSMHVYEVWNKVFEGQAARFTEAHPNVKITVSPVPFNELNTKYTTALASGKPYDIMGVYGPWMPQFLEGNNLDEAPPDIVQDITDNFPPIMKESATFDGKVYAYVQHIGDPGPVINTEIYEQAGLKEPDTWQQFLEYQAALDKKDADGKWAQLGSTLATVRGVWLMIHFSSVLLSQGGAWLTEDNSKAAFNSDIGLAALKLYKNFAHADAPENAFALKKSATDITGPWAKGLYKDQAPDLKYDSIKVFEGPAGRIIGTYTWFWGIARPADDEAKRAAWDLIQWVSAVEQYKEQYDAISLLPITIKQPPEIENDEWAQQFIRNREFSKIYYPAVPTWEQIELAVAEELERVLVGEISDEEALKNAEDKVNAILAG